MTKPSQIQPSDVAELIRIARANGLSEIVVQQGEARVEVRLAMPPESPESGFFLPAARADTGSSTSAHAPSERPANVLEILSPMTGVFYVAPSPGEPPYIHPGDIIRDGDPIGMIEAMKVFSEVLADHTGRVRHVLTSNAQLVQQGDPLVELTALDPGETLYYDR